MKSSRARTGSIARVVDRAPGDDRQPVERDPLGRDDRAAPARPTAARSTCGARGARRAARSTRAGSGRRRDPTGARSRRARPTITHDGCFRASAEPGKIAKRALRAPWYSRVRGSFMPTCDSRPDSSATWMRWASASVWLRFTPRLARRGAELAGEVLPLADAQVVQELGVAALAELVAGELALLLAQVAPQVEVGEEVGAVVGEARVLLVGLLALLGRALARVLDRQRRDDDDHLVGAAERIGLERPSGRSAGRPAGRRAGGRARSGAGRRRARPGRRSRSRATRRAG